MFLKEKIKRILNRQPEMMKSSTPLYTFYKNKYGSELLIDIVALKDIKKYLAGKAVHTYNPQIQISAESETKRSIFRKRDKTKRSKKESAQHSKSRNKSFVMTSVSAL